jgi:ribonuclease D
MRKRTIECRMVKLSTPTKDEIALLPEFARLDLNAITLVNTGAQANAAAQVLLKAPVWGFDTESKPTFVRDEQSDGPHIVQLATLDHAFVFQLHDAGCREVVAQLLAATGITKAGFGLRDDKRHILRKFQVEVNGLLELNTEFSKRGYRKEVGVKDAVATLFLQRFIKSKKVATSNWAQEHLSESQLIYAANDAYAAARVFAALPPIVITA